MVFFYGLGSQLGFTTMKSPHLLGECVSNGFVVFCWWCFFFCGFDPMVYHYDITTIWENVFRTDLLFLLVMFFFLRIRSHGISLWHHHHLGECVSNGFVVFVGDVFFLRIRSHGISLWHHHHLGEGVSNGFVVFVGDVFFCGFDPMVYHYDITTIWENVFRTDLLFLLVMFFFADSIPWYITMTSPPFGRILVTFSKHLKTIQDI